MISIDPKSTFVEEKLGVKESKSLEEVFQLIIEKGKKSLMEVGEMSPVVFLILRDHKESAFRLALYPIINRKEGDMKMHSMMIRKIIAQIRASQDVNVLELVGIISAIDSHLAVYEADSLKNEKGELDLSSPNYIRPKDNKNSKDVLCFQLEDETWRHSIYFEYIKSDLGDIVINPKPYLDKISGYVKEEDELSNMAFLFVKPTN